MRIEIAERDGDRATLRFLGAAGAVTVEGPDGTVTVAAHGTLTVTAGRYGQRVKAIDALGRVAYATIPAARAEAAGPSRKSAARARSKARAAAEAKAGPGDGHR